MKTACSRGRPDYLFHKLIYEGRLTVAQLEGIPEEDMQWFRRYFGTTGVQV